MKITEGLCIGILARSAESELLRFAQEVAKYCRKRCMMSIAVYSAWMKVYAFCGFYGRACDLYPEIIASGLSPKRSCPGASCTSPCRTAGRSSRRRSRFEPQLDAQNYRLRSVPPAMTMVPTAPSSCWRSSRMDLAITISCWMLSLAGDLAHARELATTTR